MDTAKDILIVVLALVVVIGVVPVYYRLFKLTRYMATLADIQGSLAALGNSIVAVQNKVAALEAAATGTISAADADTIKTAIDGAVSSLNTLSGISG